MASNTYEVPTEFKAEEKWFKFFKPRSAIVLLIGAVISVIIGKITGSLVCLIISLIFFGIILLSTMIPYFSNRPMSLKSVTIDTFFLRKFIHSKNRVIYVKGIDEFTYPEDLEERYEKIQEEKKKEREREAL